MNVAREGAEWMLGHKLSPFETCGEFGASAECTRPGCNMGLTVRLDVPGWDLAVIGAAITHPCASAERPLQDPVTLMYRADPLEGRN